MAHNSGSNKNFPGNAVGIEFANDDQRTSKGRNTNPSGGAYAEGKKSSQDTNDISAYPKVHRYTFFFCVGGC